MTSSCLLLQPSASAPRIFSATNNIGGHRMTRLHYSNQKEFTVAQKLKANVGVAGYCTNYHYESNNIVGHNNLKRWRSKNTSYPNVGLPSTDENYSLVNRMKALIAPLKIFCTFTRPYACMGTVFSVVSGSLIAIENLSDISPRFLIGLFKALIAFGFLMIYGTGMNQLFDIDIDKVNKPYLPLASGEMNLETGITIVVASALLAFVITYVVGSRPLLCGIFICFLLSIAYSANDISDIDGDSKFGINTFVMTLGKKRVFWMSVYLLEMTFISAIAFVATSSHLWSKLITVFGHAVLASILLKRAKSIDLKDKSSIEYFYMLLWKLFYVECLLIPFVR